MIFDEKIPTLIDVARYTNVSTATVSRCLNHPNQVTKATYKKVMSAVEQLGYSPNFGAKALASKKTNTFGAIIPTMSNAIFAEGIQAFQEKLYKNGINLIIASSSYCPKIEKKQIRMLVARGIDALLLVGYDRANEVYQFLNKHQIKVLIAWAYDLNYQQISVGFDNHKAMGIIAQKVIDFGHNNLAVISAHQKNNDRARNRIIGIKSILKKNNLDPNNLKIIETDYSIENGAKAFEHLVTNYPDITAVLCGNDVLAVGALTMAKKMKLKVPKDISITGFGNIELANVADPSLTTIEVPHHTMGQKAGSILMQMVSGKKINKSIKLKTKLHLRESLGIKPS